MKESEIEQLRTLTPEGLFIVDELLNGPAYEGQDVTELRAMIFRIFTEKMGEQPMEEKR